MIVCICKGISDREIRRRVRDGCGSVGALGRACRAGTDCGACATQLVAMVRAGRQRSARERDEGQEAGG